MNGLDSQAGRVVITILLVVIAICGVGYAAGKYNETRRRNEDAQRLAAEQKRIADLCRGAVGERVKFRSKMRFTQLDVTRSVDTDAVLVVGMVDLMNGAGALIPHQFMCTLDSKGTRLSRDVFIMKEGTTPGDMLQEAIDG